MKANDQITSDHIEFLEAALINAEIEIEELKKENEGLKVENNLFRVDRSYCM